MKNKVKKFSAPLLKYFTLLAALCITTGNLFWSLPDRSTLLFVQAIFAALYIFLSISDFNAQQAKSALPYDRFFYLPFSTVSIKVIKLGIFALAAVILLTSSSRFVFLGVLLAIIFTADLLVFLLRLKQRVYYVSLFANYILFALEEERKVFAQHIESIEYRYEIFYLKTKNNKTFPIEIARMRKHERSLFTEKFVLWVVCNKLTFTPEAREKLADIISEAL